MEKTLLWEAFAALDKTERREFAKFVRSPFFNQKPAVVALFDYLKDCAEGKNAPTPEAAFQKIAPPDSYRDNAFDDQKLRLANTDLLRLLEHFWMYREKFADTDRAKIRLAAAYRKRQLGKHFQIALREARAAREAQPFRHAEYFHDLNLIEWEQYQFSTTDKRRGEFNVQQMSDLLDKTFIARKLRMACFAQAQAALQQTEFREGLLAVVLAHVEAENLADEHPAIGLYFYGYRFLNDPTAEGDFSKFKEMLFAHADAFPEEELRVLYLFAINFGVKKMNAGQAAYFRQTLDLYQSALARNLLLENGRLSQFAYHNIAAIALRLGEVDWAADFVERYKPFLEKQHRESAFALNMARVAYARRDFDSALQNLQRSDYRDLLNHLNAKVLQLKIFYESGEFDLLDNHLAALKTFLRRQAATIGYHRENYLNIIQFTRQLMDLNPGDRAERAALREQILQANVLTEREWLLEQSAMPSMQNV